MFEVLVDRGEDNSFLSPELRAGYGGDLSFPAPPLWRPFLFSNLVASIDGIVAFGGLGASEARVISGRSEDDHWLMGLLRASADAVIAGANTLRSDTRHTWTARALRGADADALEAWRVERGAAVNPLQCFVTASGALDPDAAVFQRPDLQAIVFTTPEGASRLRLPSRVPVLQAPDEQGTGVDLRLALRTLRLEHGVRRLLCEGGPELFGGLLDIGLPDEVFHTVSPLLIGTGPEIEGRVGLTGSRAWQPATAPAFDLISARAGRRERSHLFLRYRRRQAQQRSSEFERPKSGQTVPRDTRPCQDY